MISRPSSGPWFAALLAAAIALACGAEPAHALKPIEFAGSRQAGPSDRAPIVPLPLKGPLSFETADSIIVILEDARQRSKILYDLFDVDLDGDGAPEKIAQTAVVTLLGYYGECWWGVYKNGYRDQILYWSYPEERTRLSRFPRPERLRDRADSLGFLSSVPEFYPAVEIVECGDLTGDGRSEIAVWLAGRVANNATVRGFLSPVILSPKEDRIAEVFRSILLYTQRTGLKKGDPGKAPCIVSGFRLYSRIRSSDGARDLVMEPWIPLPPDTLCMGPWLDARGLPHDPELWMPVGGIPSNAPIPDDWIIAKWDGNRYGEFRFVRDVKLD